MAGVIDCFRILKAFIILFLCFFISNVVNQNRKMLEEMPAGSTSEAGKTTFRGLRFSGS